MDILHQYFGIFEAFFTMGGVVAFVIWQKRVLKRDIAARIAREKAEREAEEAAKKY